MSDGRQDHMPGGPRAASGGDAAADARAEDARAEDARAEDARGDGPGEAVDRGADDGSGAEPAAASAERGGNWEARLARARAERERVLAGQARAGMGSGAMPGAASGAAPAAVGGLIRRPFEPGPEGEAALSLRPAGTAPPDDPLAARPKPWELQEARLAARGGQRPEAGGEAPGATGGTGPVAGPVPTGRPDARASGPRGTGGIADGARAGRGEEHGAAAGVVAATAAGNGAPASSSRLAEPEPEPLAEPLAKPVPVSERVAEPAPPRRRALAMAGIAAGVAVGLAAGLVGGLALDGFVSPNRVEAGSDGTGAGTAVPEGGVALAPSDEGGGGAALIPASESRRAGMASAGSEAGEAGAGTGADTAAATAADTDGPGDAAGDAAAVRAPGGPDALPDGPAAGAAGDEGPAELASAAARPADADADADADAGPGPVPMAAAAAPAAPSGETAPEPAGSLPSERSGAGARAGAEAGATVRATGGAASLVTLRRPSRRDAAPRIGADTHLLPAEPGPAALAAAPFAPNLPDTVGTLAALPVSTDAGAAPHVAPVRPGPFDAADAGPRAVPQVARRPVRAEDPLPPVRTPVFAPSRGGRATMPGGETAQEAAAPPVLLAAAAASDAGPAGAAPLPVAEALTASPGIGAPPAPAADPVASSWALPAAAITFAAAPALELAAPPDAQPLAPEPAAARFGLPEGRPAPAAVLVGGAAEDRARLEARGVALLPGPEAAFPTLRREVRFFHAGDAALAAIVAGDLGAELRDFSSFRPAPPEGRIEVRLPPG